MAIYNPPRNTNTATGGVSGNYVTIDTAQGIYGEKIFYSNVEFAVSGDAAILFDTYSPSSYSEIAWGFEERPKFGQYVSFDMLNAPAWTASSSGQYWSLFGYDADEDLMTVDISGNTVISSGSLSIHNLASSAGSILTVDNSGTIKNSNININSFRSYSGSASLSASNHIVNYTGTGGSTFILPPAAANAPKSILITIIHSGAGNLNIAPYGSEVIDSKLPSQSILMVPQQSLTFISDTSNKYLIT